MMKVGVVGGSGYAGGELLRLLLRHPRAELMVVTSRQYAGDYLYNVHPNLRGVTDMKFTPHDIPQMTDECELVFLATPHGVSKNFAVEYLDAGIKLIDLSADFRLKNPAGYSTWYSYEHPHPELLERAVYGLPEIYRKQLKGAELVACAGCMSGASILALAPIVKTGLVDTSKIVIDVKIGSSGGGATPTPASHHPERFGGLRPYKVVGHRHTAEINQELSQVSGREVKVGFTPHAVNMARGILTTSHLWLNQPLKDRDIWKAYRGAYGDEPFIRLVKSRKGLYQLPDPKVVVGTNNVDIGFMVDPHVDRLIIFSAIDNIVKGAAGQGVQCFNAVMGYPETSGLDMIGIH
jgi:N-acetyl-gamma-glutamyl-phosphate/LysW-gamma-L-alpha-aminoadipyl-6-phosphate reductase